MRKSIIGIVSKPSIKVQEKKSLWNTLFIRNEFVEIMQKNGCICISIIPTNININFKNENDCYIEDNLSDEEKDGLISQIKLCDGIILQGGLSSEYYEVFIAQYCISNNIPILGICAGFNNICRAIGIDTQDIYNLSSVHNIFSKKMQHSVSLPAGTFLEELLEKEELLVNSIHTQFLELSAILSDEEDDNERKIEICAIAEDNIAGYNYITIEAFLVKDTNFALAVKWHPELIDDDKNKIFGYFSDKCKEYFYQKNNC